MDSLADIASLLNKPIAIHSPYDHKDVYRPKLYARFFHVPSVAVDCFACSTLAW